MDGDQPTSFRPPRAETEYFLRERRFPGEHQRRQLGEWLWRAIFVSKERQEKLAKWRDGGADHASLCIASDDHSIHQLPWEVMFGRWRTDGDLSYFVRDQRFSIYRSLWTNPGSALRIDFPIKVVLLLSLPIEEYEKNPIDVLGEWKIIKETLKKPIQEGKIDLIVEERPTPDRVLKLLASCGPRTFVHFVGHGERNGHLLVEDEKGASTDLTAKVLVDMLRGSNALGLFLNACETAAGSVRLPDLLYAVQKQVGPGIGLGYQARISDSAAKAFAEGVHGTLLESDDPAREFGELRRIVPQERDAWWQAVLWLRRDSPRFEIARKRLRARPPAQERLDDLPSPEGRDYVYRWDAIRKAGDLIRDPSIRGILLHGIGGMGKTMLASFLARFYSPLFDRVVSAQIAPGSTPTILLSPLLECAAGEIGTLFERLDSARTLLVLDDLHRVLDAEGLAQDTAWDQILKALLRREWSGKVLITSSCVPSILGSKPGDREPTLGTVPVGELSEREIELLLRKHLLADVPLDELWEFTERRTGGCAAALIETCKAVRDLNGWSAVAANPRVATEALEERFLDDYRKRIRDEDLDAVLRLAVVRGPLAPDYYLEVCVERRLRAFLERWRYVCAGRESGLLIATVLRENLVRQGPPDRVAAARRWAAEWLEKEGTRQHKALLHIEAFDLWVDLKESDRAEVLLKALCSFLSQVGLHGRADELVRRFLTEPSLPPARRAPWFAMLGILAQERGRYDEAEAWYKKSLEIKESLGDRSGMGNTYGQLGILAQDRGKHDEAEAWFNKSIEIFQSLGDRSGMGKGYHQLGILAQLRGKYDDAEAWFNKSIEIFQSLGDRSGMGASYYQLGVLAQD
ncbi:MAG: tetratricopeptide repeat protein, partial [Planctomycetes bacterium]|nr:tetratricopeptide repeat protein [Planctomycetota bacterium]